MAEIKGKIVSVPDEYKKFNNRCQGTVRFSFFQNKGFKEVPP
jgi:hypothetical protein